ncbi:hypothetical protein BDY21DRAFT_16138 [Lineolata rhizophorae]|uniref:Uncharacterized protein n=1 Tax=Lineolata rhizophorae TaxID=578093 RepID=A0A6A6P1R1_9PEZI|nr:hypothetical protein BDY21DRAFT_16138 [Lineolata rhizophorae]
MALLAMVGLDDTEFHTSWMDGWARGSSKSAELMGHLASSTAGPGEVARADREVGPVVVAPQAPMVGDSSMWDQPCRHTHLVLDRWSRTGMGVCTDANLKSFARVLPASSISRHFSFSLYFYFAFSLVSCSIGLLLCYRRILACASQAGSTMLPLYTRIRLRNPCNLVLPFIHLLTVRE